MYVVFFIYGCLTWTQCDWAETIIFFVILLNHQCGVRYVQFGLKLTPREKELSDCINISRIEGQPSAMNMARIEAKAAHLFCPGNNKKVPRRFPLFSAQSTNTEMKWNEYKVVFPFEIKLVLQRECTEKWYSDDDNDSTSRRAWRQQWKQLGKIAYNPHKHTHTHIQIKSGKSKWAYYPSKWMT